MTDLRVTGYASRFNERDLGGDIIRRGAFSASLLSRPVPRPMLYVHDTSTPIGVGQRVVEDGIGLRVEGVIQGGVELSDRVISLVVSGAVDGLSIGYRTDRARPDVEGRELLDIDLFEISIVAFPMLPTARIDGVSPLATPLTPHRSAERIAA